MNSTTVTSAEKLEYAIQAWYGQEVFVSRSRLYSGESAVPSSTNVADYLGILRLNGDDSPSLQLESEAGDILSEIHAIYAIDTEGNRLFVDGWTGESATAEWTRWVVEK